MDLYKKAEKLEDLRVPREARFFHQHAAGPGSMMEVDGACCCAAPNDVKQMKWILSGALVDLATEEGETPLMMAALSGATPAANF